MSSTWKPNKISNLGVVITGSTPKTAIKEYYGGHYKLISPADLDNGKYIKTAHKLITEKGLSVSRILPKDTVLVGCIGNIGKIGMTIDEKSATNQQINALICNESNNPEFIYYLFSYYRNLFQERASITTLPILNKSSFENIELPVPDLHLQLKISTILSLIQQAIEQQDKIIETTTELIKSLMQKLFTEGMNGEPQKETEIGLIPESWDVGKIGDECSVLSSSMSYTQLESSKNDSDGITVIGIKVSDMNLDGNEIEIKEANLTKSIPEAIASKRCLRPNVLIFPKRGAAIATNKKRVVLKESVLDPNLIAIFPLEKVKLKYLFYWFETFDLKSITDPGPTPQLNKKDLTPLLFPLPDVKEQIQISTILDNLVRKITIQTIKKNYLSDLFNSMLHQLMSGELRVDNINLN